MQPFQGLKILDCTTLLPGPFATMYFADWGAEVLRIEAPDREDLSRTMPPFANGTSTTHAYLNRSKKTLCLDFKQPQDRLRLLALLEDYDVFIEQFRPGTMAKFGLDYPTLRALKPNLIYCSITGYGQTGPYANRAGHDVNYAALSGLAAMTGTAKEGPLLHGNPVCDLAGSYHAMFGILTALYHREKTGEGQYIDISITDSSLAMSALWVQMAAAAGQVPRWESTLLNGASFYGYYHCLDHKYLSVGCLEPKFMLGFLEAIDALEVLSWPKASPDYSQNLKAFIQKRLEQKSQSEWLDIFSRLDVCVEPVLEIDEIVGHPLYRERQMFVDVPCPDGKSQKQIASPLKYSSFKPIYRSIGLSKVDSKAL